MTSRAAAASRRASNARSGRKPAIGEERPEVDWVGASGGERMSPMHVPNALARFSVRGSTTRAASSVWNPAHSEPPPRASRRDDEDARPAASQLSARPSASAL
eukprot:355789-Chlamydomonas_euryale.AAC.4